MPGRLGALPVERECRIDADRTPPVLPKKGIWTIPRARREPTEMIAIATDDVRYLVATRRVIFIGSSDVGYRTPRRRFVPARISSPRFETARTIAEAR